MSDHIRNDKTRTPFSSHLSLGARDPIALSPSHIANPGNRHQYWGLPPRGVTLSKYHPNLGPREQVYCLVDSGLEGHNLIALHSGVMRFHVSVWRFEVRVALGPAALGMGV